MRIVDVWKQGKNVLAYCIGEDIDEKFYVAGTGDCETVKKYYVNCANEGCDEKGTVTFDGTAYGEHVWNDGTVTGATCTADGTRVFECTVCGETKSETATESALGLDFNEKIKDEAHLAALGTCKVKTTYYYDCTRCDFNAKDLAEGKEAYIYEDDVVHNFAEVEKINSDEVMSLF